MKKILIIVVVLGLVSTGIGWGEDSKAEVSEATIETHQSALEKLIQKRMEVAVELQILQLEGQGIVDRVNELRREAAKLTPKIEKLKKEFMDLTDKIKKM